CLEVIQRCPAQRSEIGMDQDIEHETDEDQDVYRINDAHPAEEGHYPRKAREIPKQDSRDKLNGKQEEHDDLVGHALQWIELAINAHMMRIGISFEDAITVIDELAHRRVK